MLRIHGIEGDDAFGHSTHLVCIINENIENPFISNEEVDKIKRNGWGTVDRLTREDRGLLAEIVRSAMQKFCYAHPDRRE